VLTPFAVAFGLAYFLNPVVNAMERFFTHDIAKSRLLRGWLEPRAAAVGVLSVLVVLLLALVVLVAVPQVYEQVAETVRKMPEYMRTLRAKVEPAYQRLNLRYPDQMEELRQRIELGLRENLPSVLTPLTRVVTLMFSSLLDFVLTLLNLVVIPVFTVYLLYDMNRIREGARDLVPPRLRPYVLSRLAEVDRLLSAFARGQITVCLILGVFYALGLTLCGVPMGLLVGFGIGFLNLVPFMSYAIGLPLALTLSLLDDKSLGAAAAVAAVFTFGQFVEGNFITPRIVGESLGLHAVVMMLALLVGGTLFGFIGMLLAVPTTAALSVFWADLRSLYLRSGFYGGGAPG
jgi:predicted PurR-regulated permease PerM